MAFFFQATPFQSRLESRLSLPGNLWAPIFESFPRQPGKAFVRRQQTSVLRAIRDVTTGDRAAKRKEGRRRRLVSRDQKGLVSEATCIMEEGSPAEGLTRRTGDREVRGSNPTCTTICTW